MKWYNQPWLATLAAFCSVIFLSFQIRSSTEDTTRQIEALHRSTELKIQAEKEIAKRRYNQDQIDAFMTTYNQYMQNWERLSDLHYSKKFTPAMNSTEGEKYEYLESKLEAKVQSLHFQGLMDSTTIKHIDRLIMFVQPYREYKEDLLPRSECLWPICTLTPKVKVWHKKTVAKNSLL